MALQLLKAKDFYLDTHQATGTGVETVAITCTCFRPGRPCTSLHLLWCFTTWRNSCRGITRATMTTSSGESPRTGRHDIGELALAKRIQHQGTSQGCRALKPDGAKLFFLFPMLSLGSLILLPDSWQLSVLTALLCDQII